MTKGKTWTKAEAKNTVILPKIHNLGRVLLPNFIAQKTT